MMTKNYADPRFGVAQLGNGVFTGLLASSSHHQQIPPAQGKIKGRPSGKQADAEASGRARGNRGNVSINLVFQLVPMLGHTVISIPVIGQHDAIEFYPVTF